MNRYDHARVCALHASPILSAADWPISWNVENNPFPIYLPLGLQPYAFDPIRPMAISWSTAGSPPKPDMGGYQTAIRIHSGSRIKRILELGWNAFASFNKFPRYAPTAAVGGPLFFPRGNYASLSHRYQVGGGQKRDGGYPVALSFRHSGQFPYQSTENDLGPIGGRRAKRLSSKPDDLFRYSAFWNRALAMREISGLDTNRQAEILAILESPVDVPDPLVGIADPDDTNSFTSRAPRSGIATVDHPEHGKFDVRWLTHWRAGFDGEAFKDHVRHETLRRANAWISPDMVRSEGNRSPRVESPRLRKPRASKYQASGPLSWEQKVAAAKARHVARLK